MFVYYDKMKNHVPIKVWLLKKELEENVLEQALNLTELLFVFK